MELKNYLELVVGRDRGLAKREFARAKQEMTRLEDEASPDLSIVTTMRRVFLEKVSYAGKSASERAVSACTLKAQKYSVTSPYGVTLFCGFAFALGHGFDNDARLPHVQEEFQYKRTGEDLVKSLAQIVTSQLRRREMIDSKDATLGFHGVIDPTDPNIADR